MADIEEMRRRFDRSPYALLMGMTCEELSRGYAKIRMEVRKDFLNWEDLIHGGVISSLLDQAFGCSLNTLDNIHVAVQLSINFMSSAPVGEVIHAESKVLHAGRSLGVAEMTVTGANGKLIARATGTTVSLGQRK
ncbi:MAG: PaaI family thioesterase [Chloroflexota bacterium]